MHEPRSRWEVWKWVVSRSRRRRVRRISRHCYCRKQSYTEIHHFTIRCARPAPSSTLAKRTELADLKGRVALDDRRARQDWLPGRPQAAALRGAHLIVTTRFPRDAAIRYAQEPDFDEWTRSPGDLRTRSAAHAERRGVLPRDCSRRAAVSTSSSTTRARPCGVRRSSTRT